MSGSTVMWTTVEVFGQRGMAEVGGSALRSAGIPHRVVADDDGGQGLPLGRINGAELQVPTEQAEEARALLRVDEAVKHDPGDWDGWDGGRPTDLPGMGAAMSWIAVFTIVVLLAALVADAFV